MSSVVSPDPAGSHLALYTSGRCVYCMRVRRAIAHLGIEVELRDVNRNPGFRRDLIAATGRSTVPALRIASGDGRDQWMHESRDIVHYLRRRYG